MALERINYNAATQQQDNWHSAAASVVYGTPTYKTLNTKLMMDYRVMFLSRRKLFLLTMMA